MADLRSDYVSQTTLDLDTSIPSIALNAQQQAVINGLKDHPGKNFSDCIVDEKKCQNSDDALKIGSISL